MSNKNSRSTRAKDQKPIQAIQSTRKNIPCETPSGDSVFVPHSVTRERMRRFIKAYEHHCGNVSAACAAAGVKRAAYYRWMKSHTKMCRDFRSRLRRILPEERLKDKLEFAANALIEQGHPQFVMFALKTKASDRGWSEKIGPPKIENSIEEEIKPIVNRINQGARIRNRTWREECIAFLEIFKPTLRPDVVEALEAMVQ